MWYYYFVFVLMFLPLIGAMSNKNIWLREKIWEMWDDSYYEFKEPFNIIVFFNFRFNLMCRDKIGTLGKISGFKALILYIS